MRARWILAAAATAALLTACADEATTEDTQSQFSEELPIGGIDDLKSDGGWGPALNCKTVPTLDPLPNPSIVISLDGLTAHLTDATTGFDKVYPIGPGLIDKGVSLTPTSEKAPGGVFYARLDQPSLVDNPNGTMPWAYSYSCRRWWKDPDSGKNIPVFAGMPFIRLEGAPTLGYALHGPIDSYTLPNGGKLRRGYVSHGCVRMESTDILELYALCLGRKVPVKVQQAVERIDGGLALDLPQRWLLSECAADTDCNFAGGICKQNPYTGRGYCTAGCDKYCSFDKFGYPVSFCVTDPEDDTLGICTLKADSLNNACARYPGLMKQTGEPRFGQPSVVADVCLPGADGWIGDPCFTDMDCALSKGICELAGVSEGKSGRCVIPCTKSCPDKPGYPVTFCVTGPAGTGQCVSKCGAAGACGAGTCSANVPRHNQPSVTANVCI